MNIFRQILTALCIILTVILSTFINCIEKQPVTGGIDTVKSSVKSSVRNLLRENILYNNTQTVADVSNKKKKIDEFDEPNHDWYKCKSWKELHNSKYYVSAYRDCREYSRHNFLFNWNKVFDVVLPYIKNYKEEAIGIINCENDRKTLYVEDMKLSPPIKCTKSYGAGVERKLVKYYSNIPAYFIFHTHPKHTFGFPSDADILTAIYDSYYGYYVSSIVFGEYGAIVYSLTDTQRDKLINLGPVAFHHYCYDVISMWNALINSTINIKMHHYIEIMYKFGIKIYVIPSPLYISVSSLYINHSILTSDDRFIYNKYDILKDIKENIIIFEKREKAAKKNKDRSKSDSKSGKSGSKKQ